jgi:hypothetical protein
MYILATLLILSCLINLYLLRALGREITKRSEIEQSVWVMKLEQDLAEHADLRYTKQREPGGNLQ